MKKIHLSIFFWVLVGLGLMASLAYFFLSASPRWGQIVALSQFSALILVAIGYWFAERKRLVYETQHTHQVATEKTELQRQYTLEKEQFSQSLQNSSHLSERSIAAVENLHSLVETTTENAKQAAILSTQSRHSTEVSVAAVSELFKSMSEVSNSSRKIEEILNLIEDIAFQTNLLALNAAVEAARAGEQGRGFAVVAEAVRSLAQKSSSAAKDIAQLINETTMNIEKGCRQAEGSHEQLNSIMSGILKVSDINNEISLSSQEQLSRMNELLKILKDLVRTHTNFSLTLKTAAPSQGEKRISETKKAPTLKIAQSPTAAVIKSIRVPTGKTLSQIAPLHRPSPSKGHTKSTTADLFQKKQANTKSPQELIPFDEDENRLKLTKASEF